METVKALGMNAQLALVALLVLGGTFKSSAEKLNSFNFGENLEFEERWSRDRRDFDSFQTQLNAATTLNITDTSACPTLPCLSSVNKAWCSAICAPDPISFGQVASTLISCYFAGICGRNFASIGFTNVNISIASGGYDGTCYLYGPQVTMRLLNQTNAVTPKGPVAAYNIYEQMYYIFEGLTLYCQPHLPCPTCVACCGSDLLTRVVCLVQNLVGYLGLRISWLTCACNCGSSGSTAAVPFQIPVTVTQYERFFIYASYQSFQYFVQFVNPYADSTVSFASPVPSTNADDITSGIVTEFNDFNTFNTIQSNFYNVISPMLTTFSTNYCFHFCP